MIYNKIQGSIWGLRRAALSVLAMTMSEGLYIMHGFDKYVGGSIFLHLSNAVKEGASTAAIRYDMSLKDAQGFQLYRRVRLWVETRCIELGCSAGLYRGGER